MPSSPKGQDSRRVGQVRKRDFAAEDESAATYQMRLMRWRRIAFVYSLEDEFEAWCVKNPTKSRMDGVRHFEKQLGLNPDYPSRGAKK